ncbi:hypothetical protein GCM10027168_66980 [Streptomyces capparidis]
MSGAPAAPGRAEAAFGSAPRLDELMPWSVPGLRTGRDWVAAPSPETLAARWRLLAAADPERRAGLFRPTRARTTDSAVTQLPGRAAPTTRLSREVGPCPEPVRIRHGAFDRLWLLPDQRLLDRARPELWRVADDAQVFAVVQPHTPEAPGPAVTFCAELPDGHRARGAGRVLPAYRLPGGRAANLAPGLTAALSARLGVPVAAEDVLAWVAALTAHPGAVRSGPRVPVPLTASAEVWRRGVALGERVLWLHTFGARRADPGADRPTGRPRMPGGRRPFVRQAVPGSGLPGGIGYDAGQEAVLLGEGRVAPVPAAAWEYRAGGGWVLREWFAARTRPEAEPGSLEAVHPAAWPREWTTELIDLVTVLALLEELHPEQAGLVRAVAGSPAVTAADLEEAGVLPAPPAAARPASVLSHEEEGPEGQFALF